MANSYKQARKARGTATMTIDPAPKTSFTDNNLDPKIAPAGSEKVSTDNAKPGATISPERNMPDLPGLKRNPTGVVKT